MLSANILKLLFFNIYFVTNLQIRVSKPPSANLIQYLKQILEHEESYDIFFDFSVEDRNLFYTYSEISFQVGKFLKNEKPIHYNKYDITFFTNQKYVFFTDSWSLLR